MATDTPGLQVSDSNGVVTGTSFSYRVHEYFEYGRSYDITVSAFSTSPVDINSLIIPGSVIRNYMWHDC